LIRRPELLQTLRTYLETGRDRRRTAQLLHLHPNSVDNRLRRCADLSGLDATDAEEAIVVRAALLAWPADEPIQP
jgi:DNA-binding PucR family transcriptional regulator